MNSLREMQISLFLIALVVMTLVAYLLIRRPRDVRLRALLGMFAAWTLAHPFSRAASEGVEFLGLDPMMCQLINHGGVMAGGYSVVLFFLFSALDDAAARRHALLQLIPLGIAVAVIAGAVLSMSGELRVEAAKIPDSLGGGPAGIPSVAIFYATANSYLMFSFATVFVWTRRYARGAEPRLRRGLGLASTGLALMVPGDAIFVTANLSRLTGNILPRPVLSLGALLMITGAAFFMIGVCYPAVVMRAAAARVWTRHLRSYHRLAPLWTVLNTQFPEDALSRVPVRPWRDLLSLRGVHRRYYRRVIECRDGLVRVSPYLAEENGQPLAARLHAGLQAHASGTAAVHRPVMVAMPDDDGLDADVRELEELADALRLQPATR